MRHRCFLYPGEISRKENTIFKFGKFTQNASGIREAGGMVSRMELNWIMICEEGGWHFMKFLKEFESRL